ncbi:head-tail connector protein [Lacticaseibacillus sp. GG6-2]
MADQPTGETDLLDKLKAHIRLEEDMDPSMLPFYLTAADRYVIKKIGHSEEYLQVMVATVMYDNRSASDLLAAALESLEPIFYLEVLTNGNEATTNQSTAVGGQTAQPAVNG